MRRASGLALAVLATIVAGAACHNDLTAPVGAPTSPPPTVTPTPTLTPSPFPIVTTPVPTPLTIMATGKAVNTCAPILSSTSSSGIVVAGNSAAAFVPGTEVLLLQVTDSVPPQTANTVTSVGNAGRFELRLVAQESAAGGAGVQLALDSSLSLSYGSGAGRAAQICSVPYYSVLTVDGSLIPPRAWDGTSGGLVAVRADELDLNGTIDASGAGFAGGAPDGGVLGGNLATLNCGTNSDGGQKGATFGPYASDGIACAESKATAGGGGNQARCGGGGGGGGGQGGAGGDGPGTGSPLPGQGGGALGASLAPRLFFGGGGGGADPIPGANSGGGPGGAGGGIVFVIGGQIVDGGGGALLADGAGGGDLAIANGIGGGGGGGAGGTIRVETTTPWIPPASEFSVTGGPGGSTTNTGASEIDGPGGGGGGGRVLYTNASIGVSSPFLRGNAGLAFDGAAHNAMPGTNGAAFAVTPLPPP